MIINLDYKLIKYFVLIIIIYLLISNIPLDKIPGKNPFILTTIIIFILLIIEQPNILFEKFDSSLPTPPLPQFLKPISTEELRTMKITSVDNNLITTPIPSNVLTLSQSNVPTPSQSIEQSTTLLSSGLPSQKSIINQTIASNKAESCNCDDIANKAITKFLTNRRILDKNGMLHYADDYFGDMGYSQLRLDNYIPLGASGDGVYDKWDLAEYSIVNTNRWKPSEKNTSKCSSDILPEPQPIGNKVPLNLQNWNYSKKVMPPDQININYINEKLNN